MGAETRIRRLASFKGLRATLLENDELRVVILPDQGAKVASIFSKSAGAELLWQHPGKRLVPKAVGSAFDAEAGWGFDEMFPGILPGLYPDEPWGGALLADHGEVWSLPWREELAGTRVEHEVHGLRFPYSLRRSATLEGESLTFSYCLENLSPFPFRCLWAAHPLFAVGQGSRLDLPGEVTEIVNAQPSPGLPSYGARYPFPFPAPAGGREGGASVPIDLREIPPLAQRASWKWWTAGRLTEGWCLLRNPEAGYLVRLSFPADRVPYLGIWLNNGDWNGQRNVGIEPATGGMDGIEAARSFGVEHLLPAHAVEEWRLTIGVEMMRTPEGGRQGLSLDSGPAAG